MRDLKRSYELRIKQRELLLKLGTKGVFPSFLLLMLGLIIGILTDWFAMGIIGQFLFYLSVASILFFARIGWSNIQIIDLICNQFSVLLTSLGLGVAVLIVDRQDDIGFGMVLVGCLLMFVGNRFSSRPPD